MKIENIIMAEANIKKPVSYDPVREKILDCEGNIVLHIAGFQHNKWLVSGADIHDCIGEYICECINSARRELMIVE